MYRHVTLNLTATTTLSLQLCLQKEMFLQRRPLKNKTIAILMKTKKKHYLIDLMGQKWSQVYDLTDPTLIENKITELLLEVLEQYAPLKYRPKKKTTLALNYPVNAWNY